MSRQLNHQKPLKREIELDFVRGLAILMVIDFHSPMGLLFYPFKLMGFQRFGWAGVDVFFVLSGFLVGGLLVKEWRVRGCIDSKRFLIRRGFKIWPQYYLFIFVALTAGHRTLKQLWGDLLNIQNYVGGVAHTWSLGVEGTHIFCWSCALPSRLDAQHGCRNLSLFLAAVTGSVVILRMVLVVNGFNVYTATHTRIDGILEGVLLAILYHYAPATFRRLQQRRWVWLVVLALVLVVFRVDSPSPLAASFRIDCANAMGIALLNACCTGIVKAAGSLSFCCLAGALLVRNLSVACVRDCPPHARDPSSTALAGTGLAGPRPNAARRAAWYRLHKTCSTFRRSTTPQYSFSHKVNCTIHTPTKSTNLS